MYKMVIIYLLFPAAMVVLAIVSKNEALPSGIEETGISRIFLKISMWIYLRVRNRVKSFSSQKIRLYIKTLEQRKDLEEAETEYFIRKISVVLMMAVAGSFLSMMMCLSTARGGHLEEGDSLKRNAFGQREYDTTLVAADENGNEIGEFELPVRTRQYSEDEANALFEKASKELLGIVLKDNESPDQVTSDLNLAEKIKDYPFDISWRSDNYDVIHFDGELKKEEIPKEGVVINLTATYRYGELKWQQAFAFRIMPQSLSAAEKVRKEIEGLLDRADEESLQEDYIILPDEYGDGEITWSEKVRDNSLFLLMLTLIGGAASYVMKDKELKKAMEARSAQMLSDYPQFLSQLVLYMGAGMTLRNIFKKLSEGYVKERKKGESRRYLYEEVLRANRELSLGASEADVYERFGIRCGSQKYTKLSTLLSQNLRKGNSELLSLLQDESKRAFDERMDEVRKSGEEAGTRLLMPMIIMLVIVMVLVMIPAYLAF
ncbi:MAG: type II secretion system F family protein [Butyrivibrio sp.]|nr:type II secretion system F family protein [Butyrivibrio sp.]